MQNGRRVTYGGVLKLAGCNPATFIFQFRLLFVTKSAKITWGEGKRVVILMFVVRGAAFGPVAQAIILKMSSDDEYHRGNEQYCFMGMEKLLGDEQDESCRKKRDWQQGTMMLDIPVHQ